MHRLMQDFYLCICIHVYIYIYMCLLYIYVYIYLYLRYIIPFNRALSMDHPYERSWARLRQASLFPKRPMAPRSERPKNSADPINWVAVEGM